jgi:DNA-binding transcriptional regulator YdaS (Cro superfamily)
MTPQTALKVAIRRVGGIAALARKLGTNYQNIQSWLENRVPGEWLVEIERITKVPREQLRPDLFKGRTLIPLKELEPA